jgi:hypothetical protein
MIYWTILINAGDLVKYEESSKAWNNSFQNHVKEDDNVVLQ